MSATLVSHMTRLRIDSKHRTRLRGKSRAKLATHASVGKVQGLAESRWARKCWKGRNCRLCWKLSWKGSRTIRETFTRLQSSLLAK